MKRADAISDLANRIDCINFNHPTRIGIDGIDASGKTMLADELADSLRLMGRIVIRVSVDDYHNCRRIRYQQGRNSAQGFYDHSFNYEALIANVLKPLGPDGDLKYRAVFFDLNSNSEVPTPRCMANPTDVLIVDGIFLHRAELRDYWNLSVFVHADFEVTTKRAQVRDLHLFESPEKVRQMYAQRYIPGQKIYLKKTSPSSLANVIWNNNDLEHPDLIINESD